MKHLFSEDTIAAVATAPGRGAIGIIRVSGGKVLALIEKCFRRQRSGKGQQQKSRQFLMNRVLTHGFWCDPDSGEVLDEVLVVIMQMPHSYTGEDVLEIHAHGGHASLERILESVISSGCGCRLAEAGEFTLRAFRNGKMDLTEAEAVNELILAETEGARKAALKALGGELKKRTREIREGIVEILASLETHLEFPMEDVEPMKPAEMDRHLMAVGEKLNKLIESGKRCAFLKRGIRTVITGRPNVGKSLLFNAILGRTRALVSPHPGTTRDSIEEYFHLGAIDILLVDTAGGRQRAAEIEQMGIERATIELESAGMVWFVVDGSSGITEGDVQWLRSIRERVENLKQKGFLLINKVDLAAGEEIDLPEDFEIHFAPSKRFMVSALTQQGLEEFLGKLEKQCLDEGVFSTESTVMVSRRQLSAFEQIGSCLQRAKEARAEGSTLDCVAMELWEAKGLLDRIDGLATEGDLLGEIFSRFCIGK